MNEPASAQTPRPSGELELTDRLIAQLEPHFDLTRQVWLRHPLDGLDCRIDLVALPRPPLDERFPFPLFGVEVKADSNELRQMTQAYKQCLDYQRCILNDPRLPKLRACALPCVALYRGRHGDRFPDDPMETLAVRLVGKYNVGVLEHARYGLELRICDERIWSARQGVSDSKTAWPATRLVANSRQRR